MNNETSASYQLSHKYEVYKANVVDPDVFCHEVTDPGLGLGFQNQVLIGTSIVVGAVEISVGLPKGAVALLSTNAL